MAPIQAPKKAPMLTCSPSPMKILDPPLTGGMGRFARRGTDQNNTYMRVEVFF